MAKDMVGNELYETDIVQVDLTTTKCIGVIKELHRNRAKRSGGPRSGYVRLVAHFDIPFEDADALLNGVVKVANPDHHKRIYGSSQAEPAPSLRRLQESAYDHRFEEETINPLH